MSKKKNNHSRPTFAEIMQAQIGTPKIESGVVLSDETPKTDANLATEVSQKIDSEPFRWCFLDGEMRWSNNFGFRSYKGDLRAFLQEIEQSIFEKFHNLTWAQVNTKQHCGNYKNGTLTKEQKNIACAPHKPDDEQLYHIHISQQHVLFGYRSDDNVFHITINDPAHEFDSL